MTLDHVREARRRIAPAIRPTPLMQHPLLSEEMGCEVWVKHENHNPTGAFKVRGGVNLMSHVAEEGGCPGVITASTGNHGQSIAFASRRFGIPCTVAVPLGNNPEKNAAIRALGATVLEHGRDFDEAREEVERLCRERGLRYVHSGNEPHLIAGVATYALEAFEELPDPDYIFVPIGGGSGACGCCLVRTLLGSSAKVIGVQAERADAFTRSWRGPERVVGASADTFAEGLATRVTFDMTFDMLKRELDDVVTLSEDELAEGVRLALRATHNLAEGAGGAALMAAMKWQDRLRGKKTICVMSGGNIDLRTLRRVLR
jgi:threonine dehydratase